MRMLRTAVLASLALLGSAFSAEAQLAQRFQHEGQLNYVHAASTMRTGANGVDPCGVLATNTASSLTISGIPAGATIVAAYLYWAGSGPADASIRFGNANLSGTTYTGSFTQGGTTLSFFTGRTDVTSRVSGNGTYTLNQLAVTNTGSYCTSEAVVKGWSLLVVYGHASQPLRRLTVFDGIHVVRSGTGAFQLTGFLAAPAHESTLSLLAWEGDATITGGETVTFNGTSLDASGDVFNSSTGYGVDLLSYDVGSLLASGSRTADIGYVTQNDLMVMQTVVASISINTVDVTPTSGTVDRQAGAYSQVFAVENTSSATDDFNLRAAAAGSPLFLQIDSITGAGIVGTTAGDSVRLTVPAQATRNVTVWYRVPPGASATNTLSLTARSVTWPGVAQATSTGAVSVRRTAPVLSIVTSVSPGGTVQPGTLLTFEVAFTNTGAAPAVTVVVHDDLPTNVLFRIGSVTSALPGGITAGVQYSNGSGWTYTPVDGGCGAPAGFDGCVTAVRWVLQSPLPAGASGTGWIEARVR